MRAGVGLFAVVVALAPASALASRLPPEQETEMIKMAAQLTRAVEVCKHHGPAKLAALRKEQRTKMLNQGVPAEKFDKVFAAQTAVATNRFNSLTPAQRQSMCDGLRNAEALKF